MKRLEGSGKMLQSSLSSGNRSTTIGEQSGRRAAPPLTISVAGRAACCALLLSVALTGQKPTAGEKARASTQGETYNAPGATYTGKGDNYQVDPQKVKAIVSAVNLEKRSITVVPAKKGGTFKVAELGAEGRTWQEVNEMELGFVMGSGQEKIMVSKSASKPLGKKSIALEELPVDSEIKVEYYPVPRMILALTVERAGAQ